ncbi:MAG TPA: hypothetical protein DCQ93_06580 [Bacteroidetes bacterium]|nr:hypothetical protein [Bacteroidota bacterium]
MKTKSVLIAAGITAGIIYLISKSKKANAEDKPVDTGGAAGGGGGGLGTTPPSNNPITPPASSGYAPYITPYPIIFASPAPSPSGILTGGTLGQVGGTLGQVGGTSAPIPIISGSGGIASGGSLGQVGGGSGGSSTPPISGSGGGSGGIASGGSLGQVGGGSSGSSTPPVSGSSGAGAPSGVSANGIPYMD